MTHTIDKAKALDLLAQALEVKGEGHTQTQCYYLTREDGYMWTPDSDYKPAPGCLVGTALYLLDKDALIKTIEEYCVNGDLINNSTVIEGLEANGIVMDEAALDVFEVAQTLQDGRYPGVYGNRTWGEAVGVASGRIDADTLNPNTPDYI